MQELTQNGSRYAHSAILVVMIIISLSLVHIIAYLDTVLSMVITKALICHNDGWLLHTGILSYGGYAFFQVHKILKWIYLTFGYVGVAHWAAVDGRPQRWT